MIPLMEAIENGLWLRADCAEYEDDFEQGVIDISYQIRPLSFTKINIAEEVDNLVKLQNIDIGSNVWLLNLEFVNLCREDIESEKLMDTLIVVDEEQYKFRTVEDSHLLCWSKFATKSGLDKFYGVNLPPKIKRKGSIAFELPEFYEELYIDVKYGDLVQV